MATLLRCWCCPPNPVLSIQIHLFLLYPSLYCPAEAEPAGEAAFFAALLRYWEGRGRPLRLPIRFLKDKPLQLYVLWTQVMSFGGYEPVRLLSDL